MVALPAGWEGVPLWLFLTSVLSTIATILTGLWRASRPCSLDNQARLAVNEVSRKKVGLLVAFVCDLGAFLPSTSVKMGIFYTFLLAYRFVLDLCYVNSGDPGAFGGIPRQRKWIGVTWLKFLVGGVAGPLIVSLDTGVAGVFYGGLTFGTAALAVSMFGCCCDVRRREVFVEWADRAMLSGAGVVASGHSDGVVGVVLIPLGLVGSVILSYEAFVSLS